MHSPPPLPIGRLPPPAPTIGFGNVKGVPIPSSPDLVTYGGDAHLMTIAPTRSGKGRSVIVPTLLTYPGPMIVFDPKRELAAITARRRREMGQRTVELAPLADGDGGDAFNPLDVFQLPGVDLETESQFVAELLSVSNKGVKDPFWDLNGCGLLSGVIAYAATCLPEEERHLSAVRSKLMCDDVVYGLAVLLDTVGKKMPPMAYDEIASFLQMSERDTRPGVLATVQSYLKPFVSQRVGKKLETSSFPILDVVAGAPLTIYISLPVDKLRSHAGWLRLVVGVLMRALTARTQIPEKPTLVVLDEAGQLGSFPFLESLMTLYAGFGVTCWLFFQDLSQLQACYPTGWKTILNNCGVIETFGIYNRDMARQWGDYFACGMEKLAALGADEQFVSIRGQGELCCRRFDYLCDPEFAGLHDPNPFYAAAVNRDAPLHPTRKRSRGPESQSV